LDPEVKIKLESERDALMARQKLADRLDLVESQINDAARFHHLTNCYVALNPRRVSLKVTVLANTYITGELAEAMTQELAALGVRRRAEPDMVGRTDAGMTMVTLKIKGCDDNVDSVLSEGEQRAMSLALFLAELRLQGHRSTIVFDDPSTSLDHHHRRHMAARIVALAGERPALVFTHDAVFLGELARFAKETDRQVLYQTISWRAQAPGFVSLGLTWETMDTAARISSLQDLVKPLEGYTADYVDESTKEQVKVAYTKFRGAIERAVREVFLNNTIRPFIDEVSVGSFGAVIGHPEVEWEQVLAIYDRCCEVTDAHDTPAERQISLPHPTDLVADLKAYEVLLDSAKKRRRLYEDARGKRTDARRKPFG